MVEQIGIALTGTIAIALSQSSSYRAHAWAPIIGLAGQPFWIYATWTSEQFGMLAVTILYTAAWSFGIYTHWIRT